MATTPLFTPALASLGDLVPHDGLLSPDELEQIAARHGRPAGAVGAARPRGCRAAAATSSCTRTSGWTPGSSRGCPARRPATTTTTSRASGSPSRRAASGRTCWSTAARTSRSGLRAGDSRQGGPGYIHRVRHDDGQPAVTIHVYSPRLDWVGQYRLGDDGVVRREVRPGRERAHRAAHRAGRARPRPRAVLSRRFDARPLAPETWADLEELFGRPRRLDRPRLLVHVLSAGRGSPACVGRTTSASSARSIESGAAAGSRVGVRCGGRPEAAGIEPSGRVTTTRTLRRSAGDEARSTTQDVAGSDRLARYVDRAHRGRGLQHRLDRARAIDFARDERALRLLEAYPVDKPDRSARRLHVLRRARASTSERGSARSSAARRRRVVMRSATPPAGARRSAFGGGSRRGARTTR